MQILIEENIIDRAKGGEKRAISDIYKAYRGPVKGFLYKIVNRVEDAEDLTQETFMKIFTHLDRYDSAYRFSTWVFAIAKNTALDWLRKNKNKELLIIDDESKPFAQFYDSHKFNLKLESDLLDLRTEMERIRPIYKSVLMLFYVQGFSYKEIAEIYNIPVNTVKTYLYRAKLILRAQLA